MKFNHRGLGEPHLPLPRRLTRIQGRSICQSAPTKSQGFANESMNSSGADPKEWMDAVYKRVGDLRPDSCGRMEARVLTRAFPALDAL